MHILSKGFGTDEFGFVQTDLGLGQRVAEPRGTPGPTPPPPVSASCAGVDLNGRKVAPKEDGAELQSDLLQEAP